MGGIKTESSNSHLKEYQIFSNYETLVYIGITEKKRQTGYESE